MTKPTEPQDSKFEERVRASFARQKFMTTLGATLGTVTPGYVTIELPFRTELTQQHGFLHAGVVSSIVDSACGYAALTLMTPDAAVLSVEFKINMLAPAKGAQFVAHGRVKKSGRTITVCEGELRAFAEGAATDDEGTLAAVMQGTMMAVRDRPGLRD